MRSIVYSQHGTPDVLSLAEREVPQPAPGEARVRIVVSGVNPTDWKSRLGAGDGSATEVESVPNQDGAGVVDAIGDGVTDVSVGDRVWIFLAAHERPAFGTAQEYTLVPARAWAFPPSRLIAPSPSPRAGRLASRRVRSTAGPCSSRAERVPSGTPPSSSRGGRALPSSRP
jgi:NADPH:quinone reductase-like Zn-dependent oxidoreductase